MYSIMLLQNHSRKKDNCFLGGEKYIVSWKQFNIYFIQKIKEVKT